MKNKETTPRETVEFLPDALEIKNQRLPWAIRLGVWAPVLAIVGGILWATFGKVDVIVQATGKLVTDQQTVVMKPLERSVVKELNVRIGDVVKENQVLITFDPTFNEAESEKLKDELSTLTAKYNRLRAEFEEKEFSVTKADDINQVRQLVIFQQRAGYFRERIKYYDASIKQYDAAAKTREDSLANQKGRLEKIHKIEAMYEDLSKKGATSHKELLQIQITRMEMESSVDELQNSLMELTHQRASTVSTKQSFVQEWLNSISEELVKTDRELSSMQRDYEKSRQLASYVYLRSPCDAVVHEIASFPAGSAVREAEALVTLIPLSGKVELEAEVQPQDIGKVEIGSEVRIKLNAYPFQKYGTLEGVIRNISEDTLQRQQQGRGTEGATYYRARVSVHGTLRGVKGKFRLIPGMEAQAEIKTGRRRIIEYLIYPLIKAFDETAREP